jgi:hypothetical protein
VVVVVVAELLRRVELLTEPALVVEDDVTEEDLLRVEEPDFAEEDCETDLLLEPVEEPVPVPEIERRRPTV